MAKFNIIAAKTRGSFGSIRSSVVNGQTIISAKPVQVRNPRTRRQMGVRSLFVDAVVAFKNMDKGVFKYAFEGQRQVESPYNAFMRENAKNGVNITAAMRSDSRFVGFGRWVMSRGSLGTFSPAFDEDRFSIPLKSSAMSAITTVGELSTALQNDYPTLRAGDIITLTIQSSGATAFDQSTLLMSYDGTHTPNFEIIQFRINRVDTTDLHDLTIEHIPAGGDSVLFGGTYGTHAANAAFIVSRQSGTGMLTSTSVTVSNDVELSIINGLIGARENIIASWGLGQDAILQGSLSE